MIAIIYAIDNLASSGLINDICLFCLVQRPKQIRHLSFGCGYRGGMCMELSRDVNRGSPFGFRLFRHLSMFGLELQGLQLVALV